MARGCSHDRLQGRNIQNIKKTYSGTAPAAAARLPPTRRCSLTAHPLPLASAQPLILPTACTCAPRRCAHCHVPPPALVPAVRFCAPACTRRHRSFSHLHVRAPSPRALLRPLIPPPVRGHRRSSFRLHARVPPPLRALLCAPPASTAGPAHATHCTAAQHHPHGHEGARLRAPHAPGHTTSPLRAHRYRVHCHPSPSLPACSRQLLVPPHALAHARPLPPPPPPPHKWPRSHCPSPVSQCHVARAACDNVVCIRAWVLACTRAIRRCHVLMPTRTRAPPVAVSTSSPRRHPPSSCSARARGLTDHAPDFDEPACQRMATSPWQRLRHGPCTPAPHPPGSPDERSAWALRMRDGDSGTRSPVAGRRRSARVLTPR
ncbi:hypothetical protein DENSPDRAFT_689023 [Dentipellis sp. KUC8613]|nr:hypothetical protein DENSPDRAFT_689023 [Dentipellis sp. KUC8613]